MTHLGTDFFCVIFDTFRDGLEFKIKKGTGNTSSFTSYCQQGISMGLTVHIFVPIL